MFFTEIIYKTENKQYMKIYSKVQNKKDQSANFALWLFAYYYIQKFPAFITIFYFTI